MNDGIGTLRARGRDDVEVDAMVLGGGGDGPGRSLEDAIAFELELLAFEVKGGEFLDVGDELFHDFGAGNGAGEVEGFFV